MRKIDLNDFQVATSETARTINRRIVMNLIRRQQPISRADLARHSGLQRSTVSSIIEQLIEERWVTEGANGHTPRGRRPRFLHLNRERVGIIGINIRPAITTFGIADLDARFLTQASLQTPADPQEFIKAIVRRLREMMKAHPQVSYEGIGVSLPGRVDQVTKRLAFAPNMNWGDVDLKTPLEKATGLPLELENAANACALAEIWFGHHQESTANLIAVTVSEGIGTGIFMQGQLLNGLKGTTGEFGHVTLVENGLLCGCGNRGCWEMYASNRAALRYYAQAKPQGRQAKAVASPTEETLAFEDILRLAEQGAPKAIEALEQMAKYLGTGLSLLVTGLAPDVIVIIGEVTRAWPRIRPIIEEVIAQRSITNLMPRVVPAEAPIDPRLRGTIALVLQKHFGAPSIA